MFGWIKRLFLCLIWSIPFHVFGTSTKEVFRNHLNPVFVETGSFLGDGIAMALEAGFNEVYSIELSPKLYQTCCDRFQGFSNVHLYLGDSSVVLKEVIHQVDDRITLWLDGHYSSGICLNTKMK